MNTEELLAEYHVKYRSPLVFIKSKLRGQYRTLCAVGYEEEDIEQSAYEAIVRAAAKYEAGNGTEFATYANNNIAFAINDLVRHECKIKRFANCQTATLGRSIYYCESKERMTRPIDAEDFVRERIAYMGQPSSVIRKIIEAQYYRGESIRDIGRALKIGFERTRQLRNLGLKRAAMKECET